MSLNPQQITNTKNELQANFDLSGLTRKQVASDLQISLTKLDHLMTLTQESLNDPWILRNYLIERVEAKGEKPVPFTALTGDWHRHWFLNSQTIEKAVMSLGDH